MNWKILFDLNYWKKQYQTVVFGIVNKSQSFIGQSNKCQNKMDIGHGVSTLQIYSMYFLHSIVKIFGMGQKVSSCLADQKFEPFLLILTL